MNVNNRSAKPPHSPGPRAAIKRRQPNIVSRAAARDYIYQERERIGDVVKSSHGKDREDAVRELDYLWKQLEFVYAAKGHRVKLDPKLVEHIESGASWPLREAKRAQPKKVQDPQESEAQHAESAPRSSYLVRCQVMDFEELYRFIDDSLKLLAARDESQRPTSKKQFRSLIFQLRMKAKYAQIPSSEPGDSTSPPRVEPPQIPPFTMSEELQLLLHERDDKRRSLEAAEADPGATKHQIGRLRGKLTRIKKQVASVERRERDEYARLRKAVLEEHRLAVNAQKRQVRKVKAERQREKEARAAVFRRIGQLEERINRTFAEVAHKVPTQMVSWDVLPPGQLTERNVLSHYDRLQRQQGAVRYDTDRIKKAYSLGPNCCYVGKNEWNEYIIFTFPYTKKALLECPRFGNAIYIIEDDWQRFSRLSKQELLSSQNSRAIKIVHKGDWFLRVKRALR